MAYKKKPKKTLAQKMSNRMRDGLNGCKEWTAYTDVYGYGVFKTGGKVRKAHRLSWEAFVGKIPDGMCVLHKCDNRKCINPDHLFLGTFSDNVKDMMKKGRHRAGIAPQIGQKNGMSKITEIQAKEIISLIGKMSQDEIAKKFKITRGQVVKISTSKAWAHLERPKNKKLKYNSKGVKVVTPEGDTLCFSNTKECAKYINSNPQSVWISCKKNYKHKGYSLSFI